MSDRQRCNYCKCVSCCCPIKNKNEIENNPSNTNTANPTINVNPVINITSTATPIPVNGECECSATVESSVPGIFLQASICPNCNELASYVRFRNVSLSGGETTELFSSFVSAPTCFSIEDGIALAASGIGFLLVNGESCRAVFNLTLFSRNEENDFYTIAIQCTDNSNNFFTSVELEPGDLPITPCQE